jgi:hypothetical protein
LVLAELQVVLELGDVLISAAVPATATHRPNDGQDTPSRLDVTGAGALHVSAGAAEAAAASPSQAPSTSATAPARRRRQIGVLRVLLRVSVVFTAYHP